jgi:hypothetical protein
VTRLCSECIHNPFRTRLLDLHQLLDLQPRQPSRRSVTFIIHNLDYIRGFTGFLAIPSTWPPLHTSPTLPHHFSASIALTFIQPNSTHPPNQPTTPPSLQPVTPLSFLLPVIIHLSPFVQDQTSSPSHPSDPQKLPGTRSECLTSHGVNRYRAQWSMFPIPTTPIFPLLTPPCSLQQCASTANNSSARIVDPDSNLAQTAYPIALLVQSPRPPFLSLGIENHRSTRQRTRGLSPDQVFVETLHFGGWSSFRSSNVWRASTPCVLAVSQSYSCPHRIVIDYDDVLPFSFPRLQNGVACRYLIDGMHQLTHGPLRIREWEGVSAGKQGKRCRCVGC